MVEGSLMASTAGVVLLACGSFNPINNMHLRMFELAKDFLNSSRKYKVIEGIISPCSDMCGTKRDLASSKHRCAMIRLAIKSSSWLRLDTWESDQEGLMEITKLLRHHYDTMDAVNHPNVIPPNTATKKRKVELNNRNISSEDSDGLTVNDIGEDPLQLKLLCGANIFETFAYPGLWKREDIEEIVGRFGMVVIDRNGCNPEKCIYESDILTRHKNNIEIVSDWIPNEVYSARIRTALRRGQSVKYLLEDSVIEYIEKHKLYTTSSVPDAAMDIGNAAITTLGLSHTSGVNLGFLDKYRNQPSPCPVDSYRDAPVHQTSRRGHSAPRSVMYGNAPPEVNHFGRSHSLDADTRLRPPAAPPGSMHAHQAYRRHRTINFDEEQRRKEYKREGSSDSITGDRSSAGRSKDPQPSRGRMMEVHRDSIDSNRYSRTPKNREYYNKDNSFDSIDSEHSMSRSPQNPTTAYSFGTDRMAAMTRHVKGIRLTPETCV